MVKSVAESILSIDTDLPIKNTFSMSSCIRLILTLNDETGPKLHLESSAAVSLWAQGSIINVPPSTNVRCSTAKINKIDRYSLATVPCYEYCLVHNKLCDSHFNSWISRKIAAGDRYCLNVPSSIHLTSPSRVSHMCPKMKMGLPTKVCPQSTILASIDTDPLTRTTFITVVQAARGQ